MATAVDAAIVEIDLALAAYAPIFEGLKDYARLDIQQHTREEVDQATQTYDSRINALKKARAGLVALVENGHPDLGIREVDASVTSDLQENAATIEAARARFSSVNTAASLAFTAGPPERK